MSSEKKENKILYKHYLSCSKCGFKFSIEHEESNNTKIGVDKMKCPMCGKPIQIDPNMLNISGKPSTEHQSRMNIEASKIAIEMAAKQKRADAEMGINKEVPVTSYQKGSDGKTERIPEKIIESIKERLQELVSPKVSGKIVSSDFRYMNGVFEVILKVPFTKLRFFLPARLILREIANEVLDTEITEVAYALK